jgi:hypothetical protein
MKLTHRLGLAMRASRINVAIRAWTLIVAFTFATSAPLWAFTQTPEPGFDLVSEVQSWPNGMMAAPYETLTFQINDSISDATIQGSVTCTGTWSGPSTLSGTAGMEVVYYGSNSGGCTGSVTATAPGDTKSVADEININ